MSQALVLDFDDTLTIRKARKSLNESQIFGNDDRIEMIKTFLDKWRSQKKVDLYILSHNEFNIVSNSIGLIYNPRNFKDIVGEETEKPDKAEYINEWKKKYDTLVFVDNDKTQYEGVDPSVITIEINKKGGLTKPDMEKIDSFFVEPPKKEEEEREEEEEENAQFITPQKRSPVRTPSSRNTKTPKSAGVDYKIFDLF